MKIFAAGDSFNDLSMIQAADTEALFRAPDSIKKQNLGLPALESYDELLGRVKEFLAR